MCSKCTVCNSSVLRLRSDHKLWRHSGTRIVYARHFFDARVAVREHVDSGQFCAQWRLKRNKPTLTLPARFARCKSGRNLTSMETPRQMRLMSEYVVPESADRNVVGLLGPVEVLTTLVKEHGLRVLGARTAEGRVTDIGSQTSRRGRKPG